MAIMADPRFVEAIDVTRRLDQTIVRWRSRPVWAHSMGDMTVTVTDLLTKTQDIVNSNDDELDVSTPPLGYINSRDSVPYALRNSDRLQKAGIDVARLTFRKMDGADQQGFGREFKDLKAVGETILGLYPTFKAAQAAIRAERPMAWSRRFALGFIRDIPVVFCRGEAVGLYDPRVNTCELMRDYIRSPMHTKLLEVMKVSNGPQEIL